MAATLTDVIRETGLAAGTVSQILRHNDSRYSTKTRARVLETARRLNYHPNALAQSIRSGRSGIIGLLIPPLWNIATDPFAGVVIAYLEQAMLTQNRKILLASLSEDELREPRLPDILVGHYVDGLLVYGCRNPSYLEYLYRNCSNLVAIDESMEHIPSLTSDHASGARMMADYLWRCGHRQFAVIGSNEPNGINVNFHLREKAFCQRLIELGIDKGGIKLYRCDPWHEGGAQKAAEKLLEADDPATVVFCLNDVLGAEVLRYFLGRGIRVPEDISVAGFDNNWFASALTPPLTTVDVDKKLLAERVAGMINDLINGRKTVSQLLPVRLIERDSVRKIP